METINTASGLLINVAVDADAEGPCSSVSSCALLDVCDWSSFATLQNLPVIDVGRFISQMFPMKGIRSSIYFTAITGNLKRNNIWFVYYLLQVFLC